MTSSPAVVAASVPVPQLCSSQAGKGRRSSNLCSAFHGTVRLGTSQPAFQSNNKQRVSSSCVAVRAAKLPAGVEAPKEEPTLPSSLWGFTEKAEVWNSRACMIGLFALIALEFFTHKGLWQLLGVEVGKGLDLPL